MFRISAHGRVETRRQRVQQGAGVLAVIALLLATLGAFASTAAAAPDAEHTITAAGIGNAKVGSTKAQLEAQLGAGYTLVPAGSVLVDLEGFEVQKAGVKQFYALANAGETLLTLFVVEDPAYQTAESIGAGSTIADAETAYGDATLSFNPDGESREFADFASGPSGRVDFRTNGGDVDFAGIYAGGAQSTTDYTDGATIQAVWVSCAPGNDCPTLPVTGPALAGVLIGLAALFIVLGGVLVIIVRRHMLGSKS